MPTKRTTTTRRPKQKTPLDSVTGWFKQWVSTKGTAEQAKARQDDLRLRLLEAVEEIGSEDDRGNFWVDLPEPVEYKDAKGKVFQYTTLKREKYLTPGQPTPDPEKAEALLRKKGQWMSEQDEKLINDLRLRLRFVVIDISPDPDALFTLLLNKKITDAQFEAALIEQKENFRFLPSES